MESLAESFRQMKKNNMVLNVVLSVLFCQRVDRCISCLVMGICWSSVTMAHGETWSRFRGPNGSGVVAEIDIPSTWTDDDYAWKCDLPGEGHSSPIAWKGRLFLLCAEPNGETRQAVGISAATGDILWTRTLAAKSHRIHSRNSFATSTPAADAEHVYVILGGSEKLVLLALDHDGKDVWQRDLGPFYGRHGYGNSPLLLDDLVVVTLIHGSEKAGHQDTPRSVVLAVDRNTGELVWSTPRENATATYGVPLVRKLPLGTSEIVGCTTIEGFFGLDPSNGSQTWSLPVFDKRIVGSPIAAGGLIFATTGSGKGGHYMVAMRPGDEPEEVYRLEKVSPYVPSLLAVNDLLFLWHDKGIVSCVNLEDGELFWRKRIGGNFSASPVCAGARIFGVSDEGEVVVIAAAGQYKLLGRNPLGELTRATPAIVDGRLYVRTLSQLICVGD